MDYEQLLLDHLGLVDQVVRGIARRHRLSVDEAEELRDAIRLRLVEHDYAVLRAFQERCSLKTFLTTVVHRFFLDQRNAKWGKWRPSLYAKRIGATAVLLEKLITRDGRPFEEAAEILRTNHGVEDSRDELYRISLGFPDRSSRHFVGEDPLATIPSNEPPPDAQLIDAERRARAPKTRQALRTALAQLAPQDQLILKMRYQDGFQVSQIARVLAIEQKPLYRRLEHVMKVLRVALEALGVDPDE